MHFSLVYGSKAEISNNHGHYHWFENEGSDLSQNFVTWNEHALQFLIVCQFCSSCQTREWHAWRLTNLSVAIFQLVISLVAIFSTSTNTVLQINYTHTWNRLVLELMCAKKQETIIVDNDKRLVCVRF